jgi:RHS repeat-associated protein
MEYEKVIHGANVVSNKWKKYIYGKSGKIAVIESDGDMLYFIKDHLGSTRVIVDENGYVKAAFDYYPFGKLLRAWVNKDTYYRYTGQEYDAKSGYYNYNLRQYNATLGRFNSVDELKQYASGYIYVGNNPFAMTDATGLWGTYDNYNNQKTRYDKNGRPLAKLDLSGMKDGITPSLMQRMLRGTSRLYTIEGAVAEQKELRRQREEQREEEQRQIEEMPTIIDQSTIPFLYSTKAYMRQEGVGIHAIFSVEGNVYITVFSNGAQLIKIAAIGSSSANMMGKTEWSALATLTDSKGNTLSTRGFQVFPGPSISSAGIDNRSTYLGTVSFTTTMNSSFNNSHNVNVNVGYLYSSPEGQAASPRLEFTIYIP